MPSLLDAVLVIVDACSEWFPVFGSKDADDRHTRLGLSTPPVTEPETVTSESGGK